MRTCEWAEKCEKVAEYTIISMSEFTVLNFCYEHVLEYVEGLLLSDTEKAWHLDIFKRVSS